MKQEHSDIFNSPFYKYHQLTKHTVEKLMSNKHFLDWANQPNPFRTYDGALEVDLPRQLIASSDDYFKTMLLLLNGQGAVEANLVASEPLVVPQAHPSNAAFISNLLFYAMSISAWKQIVGTDHRWALRVNPSSGNLHPTEAHLLLTGIDGIADGAYHYNVKKHCLEQRTTENLSAPLWHSVTNTAPPPVIICLASIFWRESWKYQQRAFRYCQHDLGHALAAIMLSAAALSWRLEIIGEFCDKDIASILGLAESDEKPFLILGLFPGLKTQEIETVESAQLAPNSLNFQGRPNTLSSEEIRYQSIEEVYEATLSEHAVANQQLVLQSALNPTIKSSGTPLTITESFDFPKADSSAIHSVVRRRRSAVDLDGQQSMSLSQLQLILANATGGFSSDFQRPTKDKQPFYFIHLYVYAHRVTGLEPGVYYWDRIKQELIPSKLGDQRQAAKFVSCFQDIAADGCFAVSMIANLKLAYELFSDRCYRYVHYEAGLIGQWFYLAAIALNYEATGIGCFLDDEINAYLHLEEGFEVIYNFTFGRAVNDPRLTSLPAYDFLA